MHPRDDAGPNHESGGEVGGEDARPPSGESPVRDPNDTLADRDDRWETLRELELWLERPMIVLSFIWLALFIVELTRGLSPLLDVLGWVIWGLFIADFALRFALAPAKRAYLATNWLTVLSLLLPALRIFCAA